jgi:signal peptidase
MALLTRIVAFLAFAVAAVAAWLVLAPAQLGGPLRYVVVDGSSMEPVLSSGDLALVRASGDVRVGDAVLYRDRVLGVDVLHRIVEVEEGRFVLKGDANGFLDDARLRPNDVEGELWFSIPRAGSAIVWAKEPLHAAVAVFVVTLLGLGGEARRTRRSTVSAAS